MTSELTIETPQWLQSLQREAGIRKMLILYGNTQDIFFDQQQRQYVTLPQLLLRLFQRNSQLQFTLSGRWDQADGLQFGDTKMRDRFLATLHGQPNPQSNQTGQSYDLGTPNAAIPNGQAKPLYPDPNDLASAIRQVMASQTERSVFVLDYSQYLVTQADHPDPTERQWMLQLAKAVTGSDVVTINSDSLRHNSRLIVFLTSKLGKIPPMIYQEDPRVHLIVVPSPSRAQRHRFFLRHMDDLRCEQPKAGKLSTPAATATAGREGLAKMLADLTDQLKIHDLKQILALSLVTPDPLPPEKLLNLYRFGDQRSPWEELSQEKLHQVDDLLKRRVVGQEQAVEQVGTMAIRAFMGLADLQHSGKGTKPKGKLFFVGPTGVGKTELAKACAEFLFGDESAFIRFDMSEYNHEHSDQRLIGAPPGYVGFEEGGQLTNAIRERPFSVLLFDEIEKAHPRILDKFLQILEDGRLTDGRGETAHFSESVIIFTSNIGASDMPDTDDPKVIQHHFLQAVEQHFVDDLKRQELFGRLGDNVVVFNKITEVNFRRAILQKKLQPLHIYLQERFGIRVHLEPEILDHFIKDSKAEHGGRGVLNELERSLINPVARFLFERLHQLRRGRTLVVTLQDEHIHFTLQEDAHEQRNIA